MSRSFRDTVLLHAENDTLAREMARFYNDVDQVITDHAPICRNRGFCCHFDRFGHRLFVTTVEMACFVRGNRNHWRPPTDRDACPFQVGDRCEARAHRPLGCRIFHCDPAAQHWQNTEYERQQSRLKALSEELGVPYSYREWLSALGEIALEGEKTDDEAARGPSSPVRGVDPVSLPVIP